MQAFCETVETAAAGQSAGEDRRLAKAHLKIQMGGMAAAIELAPADASRIHRWQERRVANIAAGASRIIVGHTDVGATLQTNPWSHQPAGRQAECDAERLHR